MYVTDGRSADQNYFGFVASHAAPVPSRYCRAAALRGTPLFFTIPPIAHERMVMDGDVSNVATGSLGLD